MESRLMSPDFNDPTEVLATVRASNGRRLIGLLSLMLLGFFLIYTAFTASPGFAWQVFLIVTGGLALWMADRMRRATAGAVELTSQGVRSSDGTEIARIEDIEHIDRGVFAFKPSNGFLLRLRPRAGRENIWQPGLWWRVGRRVGIGGMTPGSQTKFMSELISVMMAERKGE